MVGDQYTYVLVGACLATYERTSSSVKTIEDLKFRIKFIYKQSKRWGLGVGPKDKGLVINSAVHIWDDGFKGGVMSWGWGGGNVRG